MIDGNRLKFVLSTGRTGTVYLTSLLNTCVKGWQVVHEPESSRRVFMLKNVADSVAPFVEPLAFDLFVRARHSHLSRLPAGVTRIEINPFLGPLARRLPEFVSSLAAVHLVRDPRTWIPSIANFGAAGWRRHVIDWVPFARPVHPLVAKEWSTLERIERYAWWWRRINEDILSLAPTVPGFRTVRYEDIFLGGEEKAFSAVSEIVSGLGAHLSRADWRWTSERKNPSRDGRTPKWRDMTAQDRNRVLAICGPLMATFGYQEEGL